MPANPIPDAALARLIARVSGEPFPKQRMYELLHGMGSPNARRVLATLLAVLGAMSDEDRERIIRRLSG